MDNYRKKCEKAAKSGEIAKKLKNSAPLGACPSGAPKRIKRTKKRIKGGDQRIKNKS
ncbi:MAG: hypothetical protein HFK10_07155 [Clostridia bacterium]|nr:hypothetical protein [Clostridia bacterium]